MENGKEVWKEKYTKKWNMELSKFGACRCIFQYKNKMEFVQISLQTF